MIGADELYLLAVGIALPWLAGVMLVTLLPGFASLHALTRWGYGYYLGMLLPGAMLRCLDALGIGLHHAPLGLGLIAVVLLAYRALRSVPRLKAESASPGQGELLMLCLLLAIVVTRNLQILLDVSWRPLYAWDAWVNWAPKAKIWFFEGRLLEFVAPPDWLYAQPGEAVRTLVTWRYPETVPLIQLWMALCAGRWDDLAINLPWAFCAPALAMAMFGQLRTATVRPLPAALAAAMFLTVPFVNVHSFLAGYADIWMAAWLCLGAMALFNHALQPCSPQRSLLLLSMGVCPLIKLPGLVFSSLLAIAWWLSAGHLRRVWGALALVLLVGTAALIGMSVNLPGVGELIISSERVVFPRIGDYALGVHDIWPAVKVSLFFSGNWHLLWFVMPAVLLWLPRLERRSAIAAGALMFLSYAFVFGVFIFTSRYVDAVNFTSLNRAVLYLVPMSIYCFAFSCANARSRNIGRSGEGLAT